MPNLIETSACEGLLPVNVGDVTLHEMPAVRITSVAPFKGQTQAVTAALKKLGLGWPKPGASIVKDGRMILWSGRDQALLIGSEPEGLDQVAALSDQSDGWARMQLCGAGAEAVLARLVPLDLSVAVFPQGAVARSGLNHMMMVLHRDKVECFAIMVFRSMAASAVHELTGAMAAVAARKLSEHSA